GDEFPPDIRVEKECETLVRASHEIHLIARNRNRRAIEDRVDSIFVHRLTRLHRKARRLSNWVSIPHFFNPIWFLKLLSVVGKHGIDIIHVHDLPLTPVGLVVGRLRRIPVILDNHENYPALLKAVGYRGLVLYCLYNPWVFRFVEIVCARHVTHIICAGEGQRAFFIRMGVPPQKLTTVINAVDVESFSNTGKFKNTVDQYKGYFVLVYVGGFGKIICLELVIEAVALLKDKIPNLRLLLVGGKRNPRRRESLKRLCKKLAVDECVLFRDWVDFELVATYISLSAVCMAPLVPGEHVNTTTSHKLFQYMAMAKPVIITNVRLMGSIVEGENCGIVVDWNNPTQMAEAILKLYKNPEYARNLGANGRRAVIEKYNWRKVSKRLIELYKMVGDSYGGYF
ncbi:MAG: glycosyltransferase family 4 protein, partial [Thermoplasmata archaeon]